MSTLHQRRPAQPSPPQTLQPNTGPSDTAPLVPASVIKTLLLFTAAMVVVPLGSYFLLVNTLFRGNSTFAGGFAALMANVVLIGYIIVAWREDQDDGTGKGVVGTGVRVASGGGEAKKEN